MVGVEVLFSVCCKAAPSIIYLPWREKFPYSPSSRKRSSRASQGPCYTRIHSPVVHYANTFLSIVRCINTAAATTTTTNCNITSAWLILSYNLRRRLVLCRSFATVNLHQTRTQDSKFENLEPCWELIVETLSIPRMNSSHEFNWAITFGDYLAKHMNTPWRTYKYGPIDCLHGHPYDRVTKNWIPTKISACDEIFWNLRGRVSHRSNLFQRSYLRK